MDYYELLRVKKNASDEDIRKAYKILAKKYHPDVYDGDKLFAEKKMQEINIAYETLIDASKRAAYNMRLSSRKKPNQRKPQKYEKPRKATHTAAQTGIVELWNSKLGYFALAVSIIFWVMTAFTQHADITDFSMYAICFTVPLATIVIGFSKKNVNLDVFSICLVMALVNTIVYALLSTLYLDETFSWLEHVLLTPLYTCVLALFPATIALLIVKSHRRQKDK